MSLYASIGYGLVGLWILAQCAINLYVLATNQREGQCADTIDLPLNLFESATGAIRSNNVASALSSALTSLVPFIVLYLAPIYEILRHGAKHRIQGVTADGVFFWLTAAVNVLAKNAWQQPRPEAYRLCIRDKLSYGQPSGHAMWAVGIWTTCVVLFLSTRATKPKDETAATAPFHSWVYDTLALPPVYTWKNILWTTLLSVLWLFNVPFVRYDLQYHSIVQIVSGMGLGVACGVACGTLILKVPLAAWTRTVACGLWLGSVLVFSAKFDWAPLLIEIPLLVFQTTRSQTHDYSAVEMTERQKDEEWSAGDEEAWQDAIKEQKKEIPIFF